MPPANSYNEFTSSIGKISVLKREREMRCVILCLSAGATILLLSFRTRSWQEGSCGPVPLRISTGPSERAVGMGRGEAESLEERGREQHRSLAGTEAGCSRPSLPEEKGILGARINF